MPSLPRFAIGTIQEGADLQAVLMALLDTLRRGGVQTQCFASQACLPGQWTSKVVAGLPARFLDSWLMSREFCREMMIRCSSSADLAAVVGPFTPTRQEEVSGGSLNELCEWLELPRLAVVDGALIDRQGLPNRPDADAVILDLASCRRSLPGMITDIETLWNLPVVGALGSVTEARQEVAKLAPGSEISEDLCKRLSSDFQHHWRPKQFAQIIAGGTPLEGCLPEAIHDLPSSRPTVAVAYDEAFFGYFPTTLDQLELLGAQVVDFSPLRDENLPPGTDIVYLGCGRPEAFARALSDNHCMKSALRSHVSCGGRIYGEVGGAAYMSQMLETPSGELQRMCGILPIIARLQSGDSLPVPTEVTVSQDNWLASKGTRLRGYRSGRWRFESLGCQLDSSQKSCCHPDLVGCHCVVGSLIHFHFAAAPEILQSFFRPSLQSVPLHPPW